MKQTHRLLILTIILLVAAYLRFTGLNWDEGQWIHPDEGHMRIITSVIEMPDSLALYFDSSRSPLNCRNRGYEYSYGTLPLFLTRMTAEWLDRGCAETPAGPGAAVASLVARLLIPAGSCHPGAFTGAYSALVGRMFSALADLGTVWLLYLIGRKLYDERVGLLAAALGALTAFMIQQAHFFTVDSMACFFVTLTLYFSIRASRSGRWLDFGLAGLAVGLATACKIDGVMSSLLVALAALWRLLTGQERSEPFLRLGARLVLAGVLAFVAFRVAQPYSFQGPGFFGIKLSPEWLDRLEQIQACLLYTS
ncbi:MAG: glycosyltransferase family 39 protein, partial [Anaerolineae bacterium]|nr:glycosyltransferase family 39 protein [Anaerolineae bacterium]